MVDVVGGGVTRVERTGNLAHVEFAVTEEFADRLTNSRVELLPSRTAAISCPPVSVAQRAPPGAVGALLCDGTRPKVPPAHRRPRRCGGGRVVRLRDRDWCQLVSCAGEASLLDQVLKLLAKNRQLSAHCLALARLGNALVDSMTELAPKRFDEFGMLGPPPCAGARPPWTGPPRPPPDSAASPVSSRPALPLDRRLPPQLLGLDVTLLEMVREPLPLGRLVGMARRNPRKVRLKALPL